MCTTPFENSGRATHHSYKTVRHVYMMRTTPFENSECATRHSEEDRAKILMWDKCQSLL